MKLRSIISTYILFYWRIFISFWM